MMHQREEAETGNEYEQSFQSLKHGDGTNAAIILRMVVTYIQLMPFSTRL